MTQPTRGVESDRSATQIKPAAILRRRLREHGEQAAADALPATCPYTLDQITGDWLP